MFGRRLLPRPRPVNHHNETQRNLHNTHEYTKPRERPRASFHKTQRQDFCRTLPLTLGTHFGNRGHREKPCLTPGLSQTEAQQRSRHHSA
ncbi:hypothetical protein CC2G_002872 [Coprinopsis cinerea AmutBmut pab1-1]|nr:hypothetical protein CC2G_002872 [Coprinopsis cinerea AmutBmut pab1-1]